EVKNPKKRKFPKNFGARIRGSLVSVRSGKTLHAKPVRLPTFRFATTIKATSAKRVGADGLAVLKLDFRKAPVRVDRPHERPAIKAVYRASAKAAGRKLTIEAELDGGLPVKRFVNGDLVSPSVSEVLKT